MASWEQGTVLAPVLSFEDFGCEAPWKYIKSSPPLAGALPENPTERVSFCFASKAFVLVCGGAEQKPQPKAWRCRALWRL